MVFMSAIRYINRLKRIDILVRTRSTGTPAELARRLGIAERTLYGYLNDLRELGAPVIWSYDDNSYIYTDEGRFEVSYYTGR